MIHQAKGSNTLGDYHLIRELGQANLSRYILAAHQRRRTMHIVRVMHKSILDRSDEVRSLFYCELVALRAYTHPSIAPLTDILEDAKCAYIVTEHISAPRFIELCLDRVMPHPVSNFENLARRNFHQLVNIALFLDRYEIPHWFRLENVVQTSAERLVLTPFCAPDHHENLPESSEHMFILPQQYKAPELEGKNMYTSAGNVWACGVALHVLLTGRLLATDPDYARSERQKPRRLLRRIPTWISSGAQELLGLLLERNSAMRIRLRDIPSHPWFADGILETDDNSILLDGTWSDLFAVTRSNIPRGSLNAPQAEPTTQKWPSVFEISRPPDQLGYTAHQEVGRVNKTVTFEHQLPSSLRSKRLTYKFAEMNKSRPFSDAEMMKSVLQEVAEEDLKRQSSVRSSKSERKRDSSAKISRKMSRRRSDAASEQLGKSHWWSSVKFRSPLTIRRMTE